jgi:alkylation response protein AidB-like acyl-CoA dehydrogenase
MDAAERELFEDAVRRATESGSGALLDASLAEIGWHDALETDRATAVGVLFEAQGAANVTSAALDTVMTTALGLPDPAAAALLLPPLRADVAPGRVEAGRCAVRGLGTQSFAGAARALVVGTSAHGASEAFVVPAAALERTPVHGLDPALGLVAVAGELAVDAAESLGPLDWDAAVTVGQLALAHELVGTARAALELARQHALERVQFARPIAAFQAVRHRLAEALVAIESAAALTTVAWEELSPGTAALAKGLAGRSARTVVRHAQQVLAGIGFTLEHPLHGYVRRTIVLDQLLGAGSTLTRRCGSDLLATGALPAALPL